MNGSGNKNIYPPPNFREGNKVARTRMVDDRDRGRTVALAHVSQRSWLCHLHGPADPSSARRGTHSLFHFRLDTPLMGKVVWRAK